MKLMAGLAAENVADSGTKAPSVAFDRNAKITLCEHS